MSRQSALLSPHRGSPESVSAIIGWLGGSVAAFVLFSILVGAAVRNRFWAVGDGAKQAQVPMGLMLWTLMSEMGIFQQLTKEPGATIDDDDEIR
jgi:hypothetical protein